VNMLINTESGNTYTEEEYRGWLGAAGFQKAEVLPILTKTPTSSSPAGRDRAGRKSG
jgi:hypothetical protein